MSFSKIPDKNAVIFEIEGSIRFEGFVPEEEKYQLIRKSSILMGCHFLFNKSSEWTFLRPYVASAIFRGISFKREQILAGPINFLRKFHINNDDLSLKLNNKPLDEFIEGGFELMIAEKYLTVVMYELLVTGHVAPSSTVDVISPQPHYSWESAIQNIIQRCSSDKYFPGEVKLIDPNNKWWNYEMIFTKRAINNDNTASEPLHE